MSLVSFPTFPGQLFDAWRRQSHADAEPRPALAAPAGSTRDLRIDFLRGLALLVIFIDHIPGNPVGAFTPHAFGLSDAAEVFVFFSGLVCGLVYTRTLLAHGWAATWAKALRRAAQVYLAYLAVLAAMIALVELSPHRLPGEGLFFRFFSDPAAFRDAFLLRTTPGLVDVLYLYMVFLAVLPVGLWLQRRGGRVGLLAASGLLYSADQCALIPVPALCRNWFFNPFAWQFLFFIGVALGAPRPTPDREAPRSAGKPRLVGLGIAALVIVLFAMRVDVAWAAGTGPTSGAPHLSLAADRVFPLSGKPSLGPVRLAYFLVLVYVFAAIFPRQGAFFQSPIGRALIVTGRHPLPIFCVGRVLSCGGELVLDATARSAVAVAVTNVAGCLLLIALARALDRHRAARRAAAAA